MAMKLLSAREFGNPPNSTIVTVVFLDDTKRRPDGSSDPAYILRQEWGGQPPKNVSRAEYLAMIKREIRFNAIQALAELTNATDGTPIPGMDENQPL